MITPEELAAGRVYPNMHKIRSVLTDACWSLI